MELSTEVDAEGVEADGEAGTEAETLVAFAQGLLFLTGGQATEDEARLFLPGALLSFPSSFFSPL